MRYSIIIRSTHLRSHCANCSRLFEASPYLVVGRLRVEVRGFGDRRHSFVSIQTMEHEETVALVDQPNLA
jgi:hypothetical protein